MKILCLSIMMISVGCTASSSAPRKDAGPQDAGPQDTNTSQDASKSADDDTEGPDIKHQSAPDVTDSDETQPVDDDAAGPAPDTQPTLANCPIDAPEFQTINVGAVTLRVACRGKGPTLVLLHGFPEFWYGWNSVMDELAGDFNLIVPDQRGYNLSDKPAELSAYEIQHLVADIAGLIGTLESKKVVLVGHDWGGVVAWAFGAVYPQLLSKLVILNAPHPQVFARELAENPDQKKASGYIDLFMIDGIEASLSANNYALLAGSVFNDTFTDEDKAKYIAAWSQPGALTAMLNWYRANFKDGKPATAEVIIDKVPTLVLWGMKDTALLPGNLIGLDEYVTDLTIQKFENATHWIAHEEPAGVANAIRDFVNAP